MTLGLGLTGLISAQTNSPTPPSAHVPPPTPHTRSPERDRRAVPRATYRASQGPRERLPCRARQSTIDSDPQNTTICFKSLVGGVPNSSVAAFKIALVVQLCATRVGR